MDISDKPSFALLFDVRVESSRSFCNKFGASGEEWGQGQGWKEGMMFTFQTSSLMLHVLADLVRNGWVETLLLCHLLLNLYPG